MESFSAFFSVIVLFSGCFLTVRLRGFQFTHIGTALRTVLFPKKSAGTRRREKGAISSFQAMAAALGGSVGTANIAGTAGAIALGGPGAVFWMWVAALFGMGVKFSEIVLAVGSREKRGGGWIGGPMLYIEKGLMKKGRIGRRFARPLARCFAFFGLIAGCIGTPLVQANTIAESGVNMALAFRPSADPAPVRAVSAAVCAVLVGAVILGGVRRVGRISEYLVPFMSAVYILACLSVLWFFRKNLGMALGAVLRGAFGLRPAAGGLFGYGMLRAIRVGTARGVYSNEAGVGSAPMAHACAETDDPVRQGLFGVFEVFADTLVMCSLTAFAVLASGAFAVGSSSGTAIALAAFAPVFGKKAASLFLAASLLLFAYTSVIGWSVYGLRCGEWLFGRKAKLPCCAAITLCTALGAFIPAARVWRFGEMLNYLMAAPNLVALVLLSDDVRREAREYRLTERRRR
ncbi:MAG: sodium:alanine symporter family protein [Clostridia bacterium]|nr:sodium:alanine symporter family protein [Clostridia bacterium]